MLDSKEVNVKQNNAIITARYKLSLSEIRMMLCAADSLKKHNFLKTEAEVFVKDFTDTFHIKRRNTKTLSNAVNGLLTAKPILMKKPLEGWAKHNWLTSAEYEKSEGKFTLTFNEKIVSFLHDMTNVSSFSLDDISKLNSCYAIRIFELAVKWRKHGGFIASVDDIKENIGCDGSYKSYNDFARRVLTPSIESINTHTNLNVSFEPLRTKRVITHVRFSVMKTSASLNL